MDFISFKNKMHKKQLHEERMEHKYFMLIQCGLIEKSVTLDL